jgi:PAS domain S-box-containing protein
MQRALSIRGSILLMIVVMTVAPMALIINSAIQQYNQRFELATRSAERLIDELSNRHDVMLSGAEQLLSCLALLPCVQNRIPRATETLLNDLLKKNPQINNIALADLSGRVWASAVPLRAREIGDRRYFKNAVAAGSLSSGEFTVERGNHQPTLSFGYPVRGNRGEIKQVAVITFNISNYDHPLRTGALPAHTSLVLTDHKGAILLNSASPRSTGRQDSPEIMSRMRQGPDKGVFENSGKTQSAGFYAYRKLSLSQEAAPFLYLRSGFFDTSLVKETKSRLMAEAGSMLGVTIMALIFAIYFSKRGIVDKIDSLREATKRLSLGDLDIRVSDRIRGGELGELARSFDTMAQRLSDDLKDRVRIEAERQAHLLFIGALLKHAPVGIRVFNGETGACIMANEASAHIAGASIEELQSQNLHELLSWRRSGLHQVAEQVLADGGTREVETEMTTSFGKHVWVAYIISGFIVKEQTHLLVIGRDISVEKQLREENRSIEAQMLHVQKLESLGVMAGGIAHDFNNILLAVLGNAELALPGLPAGSSVQGNLRNIIKAAQRAADLARQMLAYSGKGFFRIEPIDLNSMATELNQLLAVSVSKKALLHWNLGQHLPLFPGDATQIRQVVMNLVINASEAIGEDGGTISITTGVVEYDQAFLPITWPYGELASGNYLFLEVADTGCGMAPETMERLYDPFFTTKFTGRGLGMAAVLGIIRGHNGAITLDSKPGQGTTFRVLLPAGPAVTGPEPKPAATCIPGPSSGTILLVDDEEMILAIGKKTLEKFGYRVLTASDGQAALKVYSQSPRGEIVCVLLDLTMPGLDGIQTFRKLRQIDQSALVIITSGFNEQEADFEVAGGSPAGFIQKPYRAEELRRKLLDIIANRSDGLPRLA